MSSEYSTDSVIKFLEYLGTKGLANKNTTSSRKASCTKVFAILDDVESEDVRNLDINEVMGRFGHLNGQEYTPDSLLVYKSRVNKSVEDFLRYKENPQSFKASTIRTRKRRTDYEGANDEKNASKSEIPSPTDMKHEVAATAKETEKVTTLSIPIAIRLDRVVHVSGLPLDLSKSEAQKIANVVMAMATE